MDGILPLAIAYFSWHSCSLRLTPASRALAGCGHGLLTAVTVRVARAATTVPAVIAADGAVDAKSPPPHLDTPPFSTPNQNITAPSSKDNNTANSNRNAVKIEMQPDQSLIITIVGSMSIRVCITSATIANFFLG